MFSDIPEENPYAAKNSNGEWQKGKTDIGFLEKEFGEYETATEMKNNTTSEGLKKFFDYLAEQEEIPE